MNSKLSIEAPSQIEAIAQYLCDRRDTTNVTDATVFRPLIFLKPQVGESQKKFCVSLAPKWDKLWKWNEPLIYISYTEELFVLFCDRRDTIFMDFFQKIYFLYWADDYCICRLYGFYLYVLLYVWLLPNFIKWLALNKITYFWEILLGTLQRRKFML